MCISHSEFCEYFLSFFVTDSWVWWEGELVRKSNRYLTSMAKEEEMKFLRADQKQSIPDGELGGKGYPDPDIIAFCNWLNTFDGVCTLSSCAGHLPSDTEGEYSGVLWVWFDKKRTERFRKHVFELPRPPIEFVRQVYLDGSGQRQGTGNQKEIVEFTFAGNNKGPGALDESLSALQVFFRVYYH